MTSPKDLQFRKVAPYPIEVYLTKKDTNASQKAQIVKLTEVGFLLRAEASQHYKVSEFYVVTFDLPVIGGTVSSDAKVIKTYDTLAVAGNSKQKIRTIEMHFKDLGVRERSAINSYLLQSGQKKI